MPALPDLVDQTRAAAPDLRGRLLENKSLADLTWFRVGGPAKVLFSRAEEEDLSAFLAALDPSVPVMVIGLGGRARRRGSCRSDRERRSSRVSPLSPHAGRGLRRPRRRRSEAAAGG
ncbi:hypothetical protein MKK50_21155, partial [Methylobacterium sp. J-043]|nr:hypothetical protein [Methylobacterium sp. J-043]